MIDIGQFSGVRFAVLFGTIVTGAVTSIKIQDGTLPDGSDMVDVASSHVTVADSKTNNVAEVDLYRPLKQYARCVIVRGTQNAAVDGIIAELYGSRTVPVSQTDTTVIGDLELVSPADGVA